MSQKITVHVITFCARHHPGSLKMEFIDQDAASKIADAFREDINKWYRGGGVGRQSMTYGPDAKGRILILDGGGFMACLVETVQVETSLY